jgi:hypothetical protein
VTQYWPPADFSAEGLLIKKNLLKIPYRFINIAQIKNDKNIDKAI